tara:strand:+ start:438 stop:824 length:387 start_codon:yes stop_codon:yes gene_type:complete
MIKINLVLVEDVKTILKYGLQLIKQEHVQMPDMTILQLQLVIECVRGGGGTIPESTQSVTEYDELTREDIDVFRKTIQEELNLLDDDKLINDDAELKNYISKTVHSSACIIGNAKKINGSTEYWQDVG